MSGEIKNNKQTFNGVGLNFQYVSSISNRNNLYFNQGGYKQFLFNSYDFHDFDIEFQYRPSFSLSYAILGIGYSNIGSNYSYVLENESAVSIKENVSAINFSAGMGYNRYTILQYWFTSRVTIH